MEKEPTYNYIDRYLNGILAKGRYSVTLNELTDRFDASEKAILQNVYRLKRRNRLAQIRKGFYAIVSPQYFSRKMVPPTLFVADMMGFLERDYYVGLFSAAALHGAGHQQPMQFQIMIKKPALRNIESEKLSVHFYTKTDWETDWITQKKTETGYLAVSSPELTAFDLVRYNSKIGGLNRIFSILDELSEIIKPSVLVRIAKTQTAPSIQRLGYLLNELGKTSLSNSLLRLLEADVREIPLSVAHKDRGGKMDEKWQVRINTELEL